MLANFATYSGPEAANPRSYFETDCTGEEWTRGGPVAIARPGTLPAYRPALRRAVGRIHWEETESSTCWNGHMDAPFAPPSGRPARCSIGSEGSPRADLRLF